LKAVATGGYDRSKPEEVDAAVAAITAGKILVEAIRRAGADPTRRKIITQREKMNSSDVGGFKVGFSPDNGVGSKYVEVTVIGRDGRLLR